MIDRLRKDSALGWVAIAVVVAVGLYAATVGRGLVSYDDTWLLRDNWIVQRVSWSSLGGCSAGCRARSIRETATSTMRGR